MRRFHRILFVALSNGLDAPTALEDAVALADRNDASLTILGVVVDPPTRQRCLRLPDRTDRIDDLLAAELTARLDAWAEPFAGNKITVHVEVGNPVVEIVQHVIADNHDLLVLSGDESNTNAANIRQLLRVCPVPVWFLRPDHDGGRVLAAVDPDDDSELNDSILQLAHSQALQRDGELHVAHAWEVHGLAVLAASEYVPIPRSMLARLAEETEAAHRRAFNDTLANADISEHHKHFVNGLPIQAITGLINLYRIDLLVMGSVGSARGHGLVVGNTAEQLFTKVDCSVLVLKPPGFRSPIQG